jgi:hypothetical protein
MIRHKVNKLCDSLGYMYDMNMYIGEKRKNAAGDVSATHGTVLQLVRRGKFRYINLYSPAFKWRAYRWSTD